MSSIVTDSTEPLSSEYSVPATTLGYEIHQNNPARIQLLLSGILESSDKLTKVVTILSS